MANGRVGTGTKVHKLTSGNRALCGAGNYHAIHRIASISPVTPSEEEVTCERCLKAMQNRANEPVVVEETEELPLNNVEILTAMVWELEFLFHSYPRFTPDSELIEEAPQEIIAFVSSLTEDLTTISRQYINTKRHSAGRTMETANRMIKQMLENEKSWGWNTKELLTALESALHYLTR